MLLPAWRAHPQRQTRSRATVEYRLPHRGLRLRRGGKRVQSRPCSGRSRSTIGDDRQVGVQEAIRNELLEGLLAIREPAAFLIGLHGAAVAEETLDPEADIVSRLRKARPSVPIGVVLDHHAGVSETLVAAADIIVGYKTEPHIDTAACGERAARIVTDLLAAKIGPISSCLLRLPLLLPIENLLTTRGPLSSLMARALQLAEQSDVVDISLFPGFAFSDSNATGVSVLVQTDDAPELARELAIVLGQEWWRRRDEFTVPLMGPVEAVEHALAAERGPVVLVDKADHPGAGGVGDGSLLLRLLSERRSPSAVVAPIHDPATVEKAVRVGVGGWEQFWIGGFLTGEPFVTQARVRVLTDGEYWVSGPVRRGGRESIGRTVVLEIDNIEAVVCEGRSGVDDPALLRAVGIEPTQRRILCFKALGTFRAAFEPIVQEIILVEGEGAAPQRLTELRHHHIRRPIVPYDQLADFDISSAAVLVHRSDSGHG